MISMSGSREYCSGNSTVFGPLSIDKTVGDQQGNGLILVSPRVLLVPLGSSLPNAIWRQEQVSKEYSESMIVSRDYG